MKGRTACRGAYRLGARLLALVTALLLLLPTLALGEEGTDTRWADAADAIDKYLDTAFELYMEGDASGAFSNVNNGYYRVYEVTGFERQTMNYISGVRKNAVEMQFSSCKAAVKKSNADLDTKISVRSTLMKLKSMLREDANKLAALQGGVQSEMKFYLHGELVSADPWADFSADPNAAPKYADWAEVATLLKELFDTSYQGYKDKDLDAALDNLNTAFYSVYEESGMSHKLYTDLSETDRLSMDGQFTALKKLISGTYSVVKYRKQANIAKTRAVGLAAKLDAKEAEAKAAAAAEAAEAARAAAETEEANASDPRLLTFLASFGIIVREGLEAILVIAAIIAYLVKSGNSKSLRNVYIGAIAGILASFLAAWLLSYLKSVWTGAGQSQEVIEGITALIAVCVLFYVSNWMISKAEAASWSRYIDGKVQSSVEQGSAFALAFTAFLSVFREGAEVVLFYQPRLPEGNADMVWIGFGVGCLVLVFVYLAITKLSIKLPIKAFFTATSVLMAVMCVSFLGSGIKELAEGNVFDLTLRVPGIPENDVIQVLGIYPYLETLVPQLILAIVLLITFMVAHYRGKMDALKAEYAAK